MKRNLQFSGTTGRNILSNKEYAILAEVLGTWRLHNPNALVDTLAADADDVRNTQDKEYNANVSDPDGSMMAATDHDMDDIDDEPELSSVLFLSDVRPSTGNDHEMKFYCQICSRPTPTMNNDGWPVGC
jgi:hypothetical protein